MSNTASSAPPSGLNYVSHFLSLDEYVWKARKRPVLLAMLPAAFAAGAWLPTLNWWQMLPFGVLCLLLGLCGDLGRIGGKAEEEKLFTRWGGKPTTRMLRHRDSPFDEQKLKLLHEQLGAITGSKAPTKSQEEKRPDEADKIYEGYATFLRNATRDAKKFRFVRMELINYGFARNCWGLRRLGIGVLIVVARLVWLWQHQTTLASAGMPLVLGVFTLFLFGFWAFVVRENWVRDVAEAYANRLLEAASVLQQKDNSP
jgi:hypothetical protein